MLWSFNIFFHLHVIFKEMYGDQARESEQSFIVEGSTKRSNHLTLLYIIFERNGTSFLGPLLKSGTVKSY